MIYALGPRARRVYAALRDTIVSGERVPGDQLATARGHESTQEMGK